MNKPDFSKLRVWIKRHATLTTILVVLPLLLFVGILLCGKLIFPDRSVSTILVDDVQLQTAHEENKQSIAWVTIPDTNINYPVQQAENNNYYLRRDAQGNEDVRGCVFADFECRMNRLKSLSRNLVLYGHTFSDSNYDGGFKAIQDYQQQDFALSHPYIYVTLPDAKLTYEVFSVGYAEANTDFDCIYADPQEKAYETILEKANTRRLYDLDVDVTASDKILTLCTCTGTPATRLLVVSKLVGTEDAGR